MKSLRWRIVILLISLVCGVLFLTSSIIDYTLNRSFQHYLSEFHRQRREEMINTLTRIHQVAESWEEFFKLPSAPLILRSAGVVRLTDEDGRTLFLREEFKEMKFLVSNADKIVERKIADIAERFCKIFFPERWVCTLELTIASSLLAL